MQASFAVHCMGAETELRRAWRNYSHPPPDHYDPVTAASFELFQKMWAQHIKPGVEQAHNQRLKVADYSGQRRELLEDFIFKALDEITRRLWDRSETNTDLVRPLAVGRDEGRRLCLTLFFLSLQQHAVRELMSQIVSCPPPILPFADPSLVAEL